MRSQTGSEVEAISFAERVLNLLDQGSFTSTYKYAVLLGLMDVVLEQNSQSGLLPATITTRQLAEKVTEIYWSHSVPFELDSNKTMTILQNKGGPGAQAAIIKNIELFKEQTGAGKYSAWYASKLQHPEAFHNLISKVEKTLITMPLPKLQRMGNTYKPFIYDIHWDDSVRVGAISTYQKSLKHGQADSGGFDNRIILQPGVAGYFLKLNTLLRGFIQREWLLKVADQNKLPESRLHQYLFESRRRGAAKLCGSLQELQNNDCFYCHERLENTGSRQPEVDHFIPWSRYADDSVANYVVAHRLCNSYKKDFLAAIEHVEVWVNRMNNQDNMNALREIADQFNWKPGKESSLSVAAAIYNNLLPEVELWKIGKEFVPMDRKRLDKLFA